MSIVKIHCGSAHVAGRARQYAYAVASLFVPHTTRDGRVVWRNSGISTSPRRGEGILKREAMALAERHGATFVPGYGSLHNRPVA